MSGWLMIYLIFYNNIFNCHFEYLFGLESVLSVTILLNNFTLRHFHFQFKHILFDGFKYFTVTLTLVTVLSFLSLSLWMLMSFCLDYWLDLPYWHLLSLSLSPLTFTFTFFFLSINVTYLRLTVLSTYLSKYFTVTLT